MSGDGDSCMRGWMRTGTILSKVLKTQRLRIDVLDLTPRLQGTRLNLILPETTVETTVVTSSPLIVCVYLRSNFRDGLRKRMYFETECEMAVQGHPRSLILVYK